MVRVYQISRGHPQAVTRDNHVKASPRVGRQAPKSLYTPIQHEVVDACDAARRQGCRELHGKALAKGGIQRQKGEHHRGQGQAVFPEHARVRNLVDLNIHLCCYATTGLKQHNTTDNKWKIEALSSLARSLARYSFSPFLSSFQQSSKLLNLPFFLAPT